KKIKYVIIAEIKSSGITKCINLLMDFFFLTKMSEAKIIKLIFANSEGCREKIPRSIQLREPPALIPISGINTNISNITFTNIKRYDR
ncbi:unnamed protein product, partial [marine sediment metagenome]